MDEKKRDYRALKNDLERLEIEDDIDLREEDFFKPGMKLTPDPTLAQKAGRGIRNFLAVLLCVVITGLWYYDWNFSLLASRTSDLVTSIFGSGEVEEYNLTNFEGELPPLPEIPELPDQVEVDVQAEIAENMNTQEMSMTEYVVAMEESGYRDLFEMPAISALYQSGVPIAYLDELNDAGYLQELSFPAIITFHSTGMPTEYLNGMKSGGYLDQFGFPGITAFYTSGITVEYLDDLKVKGILEGLSFSDILIMHQSE